MKGGDESKDLQVGGMGTVSREAAWLLDVKVAVNVD